MTFDCRNTTAYNHNHNNNKKKKKRQLQDLHQNHNQDSHVNSLKMFLNTAAACCRWPSAGLLVVTTCLLLAALAPSPTLGQLELDGSSMLAPPSLSHHQVQEILVQPNSQVRIECRIPKSQRSSSYWNFLQRTAGKEAKPHLLYFDRVPIYQSKPDFGIQLAVEPEAGAYDLVINNVTYELNDGIYYCDYQDTETRQTINREFRLTVLIPPQAPSIQPVQPSAQAREGQEYQLQCQSQGGNPEPNITWFRNEQPVALRPDKTHANGSTTSTLSWIPTMDDHNAVYKCLVWNKAMSGMQAYERELRIQVEYAPRISVGPFNPLRVLVGTSLTLPCLVEANPPVKGIRWFKDGHLISNQYNHSIGEIKISDAGLYTCQADNGIAPPLVSGLSSLFGGDSRSELKTSVESQLQLQVLYPPRVHLKPSRAQPLNEGDPFTLNCSVDSWPPAHEFIWTKHDDPTFRRHSSSSSAPTSVLEFHHASAADMGNYTCTAVNRMEPSGGQAAMQVIERQGAASYFLYVRHKPGAGEISVGQAGVAELGAKTQIHCHAKPPGFPEPQFKFWKVLANGQKFYPAKQALGATYTIHAAKSEDEAKYGCSAINALGESSEAEAELIVQEPPAIIHDASARRDEDTRPPGDSPYSITVRAYGKPEPKVSWFHRSPVDGRRVELSGAEMDSRFRIDTVTKPDQSGHLRPKFQVVSTLTFKNPLAIDDRGRYTVEFSNGLSRSASEHFQLHINHAPIPAPRNGQLSVVASGSGSQLANSGDQMLQRWKAGFDLGETVNLTCRVSAHPRPEFLWHTSNDQAIENNPRYSVQVHNPIDDIWESTLTFSQAQESDYGDYSCSMANRDPYTNILGDTLRILINLSRKTVPDAPRQLETLDSTQDSITLQWLAGFDGGFALNQYLVQYAPDDGSGQPLGKRFALADSQLAPAPGDYLGSLESQQLAGAAIATYPRLYDCLAMNPCTINQLLPRQVYVFRVRAKNELGFSEFSDELRASTRANVSQIPKILDASFDSHNNVLYFRIEPGSDYLLNQLVARIEVRSPTQQQQQLPTSINGDQSSQQEPGVQEISINSLQQQQPEVWRFHSSVLIRQERAEAYLNVQRDVEQLRITVCSRSNESLCGAEFVVGTKTAASSFMRDQRGVSLSILMCTLVLILVLAAFATSVHSCCFARKSDKKAAGIERIEGNIDNKPAATNGVNQASGNGSLANGHGHKSAHGSTTSTNSTTANGASNGGLASIDSINGALNGGSASDHSSDHSRQAKLDSMLPPNYNHYADRASIMMEQQQQQQQQMMQQQQGLMSDKSGPFGLPNSALLSVAGQQQQPSPMMNGSLGHFTYGQAGAQLVDSSQQSMQLDHHQHHHAMMNGNGALLMGSGLEQADGEQQQHQMWPTSQMDDYDYNALGYVTQAQHQQQQQQQDQQQIIDPTYGTTTATGGVIMSPHSAAYDNSANNSQFQSYLSAYQPAESAQQYQQQRAQYQQEMAVAQQQMYGTLTRNGYATGANNNNSNQPQASNAQDQQQQQYNSAAASGLVQPPPPPPPPVVNQAQESDYGTTGARSGRLIREIIV